MIEITEAEFEEYQALKKNKELFDNSNLYHQKYFQDNLKEKVKYCAHCNLEVKYMSWCNHIKSKTHLSKVKDLLLEV